MTTLQNTLAGIPSGTTVTTGNSGGASGDAFDVVTAGTGATVAADNTQAIHSPVSLKLATGGTASQANVGWSSKLTTGGNPVQVWFRFYAVLTANPAASLRLFDPTLSGTAAATFRISTSGKLQVLNTAGSSITTSTASIPLNALFRVEGFVTCSATVGQTEVKLFTSAESVTAAETDTSTAAQNTNTAVDTALFGWNNNAANMGPLWIGAFAVSTTGYPGPYSSAVTAPPYVISQYAGFY